jgi:hypothetical protein
VAAPAKMAVKLPASDPESRGAVLEQRRPHQ